MNDIPLKNAITDTQIGPLLDLIQAGVAVLRWEDETLIPLYANEGFSHIMQADQASLNAIYRKDAYKGVHPADKARIMAVFNHAAKSCSDIKDAYRLLNPAGDYIWVSISANPIKQEDGSINFYVVYTDLTEEKKRLEEARLREEAINVAVEQTGINIWELDLNTHVMTQRRHNLLTNIFPNATTIDNIPERLIQSGLLHEADIPLVRKIHEDVFAGNPRCECTARWWSKQDCEWKYIKTIYSTVYDANGHPIKAIGSAMDITDQVKLEKRYEEFKTYQYFILTQSFSAFHINVTQNKIEQIICATESMKDVPDSASLDEFFAQSAKNVITPAARAQHTKIFSQEQLLKNYASGNIRIVQECLYKLSEEKTQWVSLIMNLTQNPTSGDIIGFAHAEDIQDDKLLEFSVEHLLSKDFDQVVLINTKSATCRILESKADGYSGFSKTSVPYNEQLTARAKSAIDPACWQQYFEGTKLGVIIKQLETKQEYELVIRGHLDGGETRVKHYCYNYLDDSHEHILLTRSDITQSVEEQTILNNRLRTALAEAKRADEAKSNFLSRMSHDMRTPMNGIMGLTNLTLELGECSEEIRDNLEGIKSSSEYLLSLINDVLDMSKIESNKLVLHPKPVHGQKLIHDVLGSVQTLADEKQIALEVQLINTNLSWILADRLRIQQIFINLLSNSIKFTPKGGKIEWIVEKLGFENNTYHERIIVRDNGIGMSEAFLPKLFLPFAQEENNLSSPYSGTGLGMPIVKQLVEAMGGRISVKSQKGVGTETTIDMYFTACEAQSAEPIDSCPVYDLTGKHILICEDHPVNMQISCRLLEKRGMLITQAKNGLEGVCAFANAPNDFFDAVLMDIRMPVMDGLTAARNIRALEKPYAKTVPIIAMTANAYESDREKSLKAGMNAHLSKPIEAERLYETIGMYLNKK